MNPQVVAAVIAASVSFLTLIGTLIAQYLGRRATKRDTETTLAQQSEQLEITLAAQREQLDRTLLEQSKQLDKTLAEQRTRTLNDRFTTAAEQLGSDKPAVRLAGVHAMAGLADDWEENRQTCVDVLCGYLRMPYEPDPGQDAPESQQLAFHAIREVRHTVIRVITAHLKEDAAISWQGLNFDFTGVVFDGGDFNDAEFSDGTVNFSHARFCSGRVDFADAVFSGATVYFTAAQFSGGTINFISTEFADGRVNFTDAKFSKSTVRFIGAVFSGARVNFGAAQFSGGTVNFSGAEFHDGTVNFIDAEFSGGTVDFSGAEFSSATVFFKSAKFSSGTVRFIGAKFSGGMIDFSDPKDWSSPPIFTWTDPPPSDVKLPR
jgi:uncharacterized protein YjbI with pentapeptide repeats